MKTLLLTFLWIGLTSSAIFSQSERIYKDTIKNANYKDSILYDADFDSTLFIGDAIFYQTHFNYRANFSGTQFNSLAGFTKAYFNFPTTFSGVHFEAGADFPDTRFKSKATFSGVHFKTRSGFYKARFKSEADFSNTYFFNSQALFHATKFKSNTSFFSAYFEYGADFSEAQFDSLAHFFAAHFDSISTFSKTYFKSKVNFSNSQFTSIVSFSEAQFDSETNFSNRQFKSVANFSKAHFETLTYFSEAQFDSLACFSRVKFGSRADFSGAQFNYRAVFHDTQFDAQTDFSGVKFGSRADFTKARFNENPKNEVIFRDAILPDTLFFDDVKQIAHEIDFTFCHLDTGQQVCHINLVDTDVGKIKLRYSRFQLFFPKEIEYEKKSNVYEQLLAVQKKHGFTESYEKLDKEYQAFKYTTKKDTTDVVVLGHVFNFAQKHWWGYGYDKELVIRNTFILLILFTLINYRFFHFMNEEVYKIEKVWTAYQGKEEARQQRKRVNRQKNKIVSGVNFNFNKWVYTFYYTSLVFFGLRLSVENINYTHRGGVAYLLFQYTVGLVCLAYIANFIILS